MKKLMIKLTAILFLGVSMLSCEKEEIQPNLSTNNSDNTESTIFKKASGNSNYVEITRSYKWIENNTVLDCSAPGKGCTVKSSYINNGNEIDITVNQVMKLLTMTEDNGAIIIKNNMLKHEFPEFYTDEMLLKIQNGDIKLFFEFPYLKILNQQDELIKVYNYEHTITDNQVANKLQAGGATKKIAVNTKPGEGPWKCTEAGNNCKVSKLRLDLHWAAANPKYSIFPSNGNQTIIGVEKDVNSRRVKVRTASGLEYGIVL
ncbi:hypothetical protein [Lutibacter sp.]